MVRAWRRRIVPLVAVALAAGVVAGFLIPADKPVKPAPALPTVVLNAPAVTLASFRGHPAIVDFFANYCGPCHDEAPALERFATSPAGRGHFVAVDYSDTASGARGFIRRYHWTMPVLSDPTGRSGVRYGLSEMPTAFILDSRGRIVGHLVGPQTVTSLTSALRSTS